MIDEKDFIKQIKKVSNALKSDKLEKAKKLEELDTDYDIN